METHQVAYMLSNFVPLRETVFAQTMCTGNCNEFISHSESIQRMQYSMHSTGKEVLWTQRIKAEVSNKAGVSEVAGSTRILSHLLYRTTCYISKQEDKVWSHEGCGNTVGCKYMNRQ